LPDSPLINDWLTAEEPISDEELARLQKLKAFAVERILDWNEEDLKIQLISRLIDFGDFYTTTLRVF
jgi:hypothetical protein